MPLTKGQYIVKENPALVQWERELRKFLRNLSPRHEHRVSAVMVYEWATGKRVADQIKEGVPTQGDLRHLNFLLREYFGTAYSTYICGRKVPNAYKVKGGYHITRHRPQTLTLWVEYKEGVLNP